MSLNKFTSQAKPQPQINPRFNTLVIDTILTQAGNIFPNAIGASGTVLQNDGAGNLVWVPNGGGGAGDVNFTGAGPSINEISTYASTDGKTIKNSSSGPSTLSSALDMKTNNIQNVGNVTASSLNVGALSYPSVDGSDGYVVTTNGSGVLSLQVSPSNSAVKGVYTPTVTNVQQSGSGNFGADSHYFGSGSTIGSEITVFAKININATAANPWVNVSLPIATSSPPNFGQVVGLGTIFRNVVTPALSDVGLVWGVQSDGANSGAVVKCTVPTFTANYDAQIAFTYTIS